jgi:2,3-dimethylmalate lyase
MTAVLDRRRRLKAAVDERRALPAPGAFECVSARLVEAAGFAAVYVTGYGTSASRLGLPDLGFTGLAEVTDQARNIAGCVDVPVIIDADTGYGNAVNVGRTVQMFERSGVAAIHLEDQVFPKRSGTLTGKQLVGVEDAADKIRAAVAARADSGLLIIARTDAMGVTGFDDAVARARTYAAAGADLLFVEGLDSMAQVEALPTLVDRPCVFNYGAAGPLPPASLAALRNLGYGLVIFPAHALLVAAHAIETYLAALRESDVAPALSGRAMPLPQLAQLLASHRELELGGNPSS